MVKKPAKKSNVVSLDFEGVEVSILVPEGDHTVKAVEVTKEEGDEHPYLSWIYEVQGGKGGKLYENTSLSPRALWRLRGLLEAAGVEVPDGQLDIDLDSICDEMSEFCVTVEHEKWEGKTKARVVDVFPLDGDSDDEDDEPKGRKKSSKKGDDDEDEKPAKGKKGDDDGIDLDAIGEMDEEELEELIDEHDLDVDLDDYSTLKKKRAAVKEAAEAANGSGDDDEDEKPAKGKKGKSYTEDDINEMGTKELQGVVDEGGLDIELEGSTKTKRRAVIKALKAKGMIEE